MFLVKTKTKSVELKNIPKEHWLSNQKRWYKFLIIRYKKPFSYQCWLCDTKGSVISLVL